MTKIARLTYGLFITAELLFIDCALGAAITFSRTRTRDIKRQAPVIIRNTGRLMALQAALVLPPALALLYAGVMPYDASRLFSPIDVL